MLSERLSTITPNKANDGCTTCKWLLTLSEKDVKSFNEWIANGNSMRQLWHVCSSDPDNPLPISLSALKNHIKDCRK